MVSNIVSRSNAFVYKSKRFKMSSCAIRSIMLSMSSTAFNNGICFSDCKVISGFTGYAALLTNDGGKKIAVSIPLLTKIRSFIWSDVQADFVNCIYPQLPSEYRMLCDPIFRAHEQITIPLTEGTRISHHLIVGLTQRITKAMEWVHYEPVLHTRTLQTCPDTNNQNIQPNSKLISLLREFTRELRAVNYDNINLLMSPDVAIDIISRDYVRIGVKFPVDEQCIMDTARFRAQMQAAWEDMLKENPNLKDVVTNHRITLKEPFILTQQLPCAGTDQNKESAQFTFNYKADFNVLALTSVIGVPSMSGLSLQTDRTSRDRSVWGPMGDQIDERREAEERRQREQREQRERAEEARRIDERRAARQAQLIRENKPCDCGKVSPRSFSK